MSRSCGPWPETRRRWRSAVACAVCLALAGCAQSGALLTGSIGPSAQPSADGRAGPPLPEQRAAKTKPEEDDSTGLLAALSDIDLSTPAVAPSSVVTQEEPVNVYVRVAREIRRCWLGPENPKLPGHGFLASAQPGEAGEAEIDIYKKAEGRKYGPFAFEVKITPEGSGALVRSRNRGLDDALADTLRADVARWTRGASGCEAASAKNT